MKKVCFKILFSLLLLHLPGAYCAQEIDSLNQINEKYEVLLKSDKDALNVLFYKHDNDVLISNLGPFGSPYYYHTAFWLYGNCLALGSVQTEMLDEAFPGFKAQVSASEMAAYIHSFSIQDPICINGKIIPVSNSTP